MYTSMLHTLKYLLGVAYSDCKAQRSDGQRLLRRLILSHSLSFVRYLGAYRDENQGHIRPTEQMQATVTRLIFALKRGSVRLVRHENRIRYQLSLKRREILQSKSRARSHVYPCQGLKSLGIIAAATQLAAYSIKIVLHLDSFYAELRSTPIRTRQHLNQVKELIDTANLIQQHKSLRSPVINAKLQRTLSEEWSLYDILEESSAKYSAKSICKYWAVLKGADEHKILTSLKQLEREKSALRLCISIIHTDLLVDIQDTIDKVSEAKMATLSGEGLTTSEAAVSVFIDVLHSR